MGRKKYYCDFCDRYFNDDKNTREKHLNSVSHSNMKKAHYNMFRDPETLLQEESVKKPCRKFHVEGYCPFGGSCTFSHYSQHDLNAIKQDLMIKKMKEQQVEPTLESWLVTYKQSLDEEAEKNEKLLWSCELPPELIVVSSEALYRVFSFILICIMNLMKLLSLMRSVEAEAGGKSWGELRALTQNWVQGQKFVDALCSEQE